MRNNRPKDLPGKTATAAGLVLLAGFVVWRNLNRPPAPPAPSPKPSGIPQKPTTPVQQPPKLPRVRLGTSSELELAAVPAIGPDLARKIVEMRPTNRKMELPDLIRAADGDMAKVRGVLEAADY